VIYGFFKVVRTTLVRSNCYFCPEYGARNRESMGVSSGKGAIIVVKLNSASESPTFREKVMFKRKKNLGGIEKKLIRGGVGLLMTRQALRSLKSVSQHRPKGNRD